MNREKLKDVLDLFLISLISLYFELLIIRWLSSEIRIFAYFKNIPLMACVFGLGLGLGLSNHKRVFSSYWPYGLLALCTIISFASPLHLVHVSCINPAEHYILGEAWMRFTGEVSYLDKVGMILPGLAVLVIVFYLMAFTFACLGQKLGQTFDKFPPLPAYSINVGASLLGILLFSGLSYLSLKPEHWLLVGCALCLRFYYKPLQAAALVACVAIAFFTSAPGVIWSPYYRVSTAPVVIEADGNSPPLMYGHQITVNYDGIEGAYDNSPATIAKASPKQKKQLLEYYDYLYELIGDKPRSMLVLASGAGNDLAAALRHGATEIDALEIDPVIVQLGKKLHPEKPYDNPKVTVHVDDARAFLSRCKKQYDLVDFAYLDSHSAFSSMSSIRLDNYIYTVESFRSAAKLMKPDGIMAVTFYPTTSWQMTRIFKTITEALGEEPIGIHSDHALTFLVGPGVDREAIKKKGFKLFDKEEQKKLNAVEMASWDRINPTTDDWPFLFLRQREMTFTYAAGLIFTICIGWRLVRRCFGSYFVNPTGKTMLFLGAAFMLMEVKSVSQMGLLAGTTWIVNSIVIASILLMILVANLIQMKLQLKNVTVLYGLLLVSLLVSYFTPLSALNALPIVERLALGSLVLCLPFVFASMIFAISFSRVKDGHSALGMNLLGTLIGGALEYSSMILGISALNLVAIVLYACAFFYWRKAEKQGVEGSEELQAAET